MLNEAEEPHMLLEIDDALHQKLLDLTLDRGDASLG